MALLQISEPGLSAAPHQRRLAAGIDLGTTNSLVATVRSGQAETLADHEGRHLLPSVVHYQQQGHSVGYDARTNAALDTANTISSVKRLMGRSLADIQQRYPHLPYQFQASENGLPLWNGDILFFNVPEVILCVAIFGVLVGLVNGAVITRFGVAPFICTLGMMYVARGSALLFNDGSTYPNLNGMEALGNTGFATLGSGTLLGVYLPIWLMIGFLVLGYWLTTKTPLGRYIYAIGGNESAARLAGVPIVKAKIFVYAFSGLCAAFVGLIVASQLQTAHPMTGNMFEMDAIGATVLGGTALAGGRGRVTGSIIGAFVIVFLADGMVMMGVSDFWQMVIKGVVIVTAVVVDQFQQKLQSKVILMRRHEEKLAAIPPNGATSS